MYDVSVLFLVDWSEVSPVGLMPLHGGVALLTGKLVLAQHSQIYKPSRFCIPALTTDMNMRTLQGHCITQEFEALLRWSRLKELAECWRGTFLLSDRASFIIKRQIFLKDLAFYKQCNYLQG